MIDQAIAEMERRMAKSVEATAHDFATVRTGRASPALLDHIHVNCYGGQNMPLNQLATVSAPEPRLLVIAPWDKSVIDDIQKAITSSDLGLIPHVDAEVIRLPIPQLTEERRREMVKVVGKKAESGRVAVRNIRRDTLEHIRRDAKDQGVSEDDVHRAQSRIDEITNKHIEEIDKLRAAKEEELMEI